MSSVLSGCSVVCCAVFTSALLDLLVWAWPGAGPGAGPDVAVRAALGLRFVRWTEDVFFVGLGTAVGAGRCFTVMFLSLAFFGGGAAGAVGLGVTSGSIGSSVELMTRIVW